MQAKYGKKFPIYKGFSHFVDTVETYPQTHFDNLKNKAILVILWITIKINFNILKQIIT